jgi:hypothetical protein
METVFKIHLENGSLKITKIKGIRKGESTSQEDFHLSTSNILKMFSPDISGIKVPIQVPKDRKNTGIQVVISNTPRPTVISIKARSRRELPSAYLKSVLPQVWQAEDRLMCGVNYALLEENMSYLPSYFKKALRYIQLAGEHLALLNKEVDLNQIDSGIVKFKDGKLEV